MEIVLSVLSFISMIVISICYLKAPLKEKGYNNKSSLLIRIIVGLVLGGIITLLISI